MIRSYIDAALRHAHYEMIEQAGTPYYGEIPNLSGVMATGETLEQCRENLEDALDQWIALGLQLGHQLPSMDGIELQQLRTSA